MRADMARVIVERPRIGSRFKKQRKGYKRDRSRDDWEGQRRAEGIKRRAGDTRHFNVYLGPLRRYLVSNAGRPWNKVFSEICARVSRNSAVQDHVRDHVQNLVVTHVVLIDGVPCHGEGRNHGRPIQPNAWNSLLYVCPRTGLLRRVKAPKTVRARTSARVPGPIRVSATQQCHFLDGAWYLVTVAPFPPEPWRAQCKKLDVVRNRRVCDMSAHEVEKVYGAAVYAVSKRLLGKKERKQYPIPADRR